MSENGENLYKQIYKMQYRNFKERVKNRADWEKCEKKAKIRIRM